MAWTAPRTWVAGEIVTAAIGNTHWRDNLLDLADGSWGIDKTVVLKSADETVTNSATVQSDDHLLFTASANAKYLVEFQLFVSQNANAVGADFKFGFSLPASASWSGGDGLPDLTVGTTAAGDGNWTALSAASAATRACGLDGNSGNITGLSFTVLVSIAGTAGTVTFQWAQNTATAGVGTTVKANSWLRAVRVA
jgi:hypothetical protein